MSHITIDRSTRRKRRVSRNIVGSETRPRIAIHRSNKYIYAQAIDDAKRLTLASFSSLQLSKKGTVEGSKSEQAKQVGLKLAELLFEKKIVAGVFDRGRYTYNGRVKVLAEGLREGKLKI
jgi:large subunit ribosomal protein L18